MKMESPPRRNRHQAFDIAFGQTMSLSLLRRDISFRQPSFEQRCLGAHFHLVNKQIRFDCRLFCYTKIQYRRSPIFYIEDPVEPGIGFHRDQ